MSRVRQHVIQSYPRDSYTEAILNLLLCICLNLEPLLRKTQMRTCTIHRCCAIYSLPSTLYRLTLLTLGTPPSSVRTTSARETICALWLIITLVQLTSSAFTSLATRRSVSWSTLAVPSSTSRILECVKRWCSIARATRNSCVWPLENFIAFMVASRPPRPTMCSSSPTRSSISVMIASMGGEVAVGWELNLKGSMLYRTEPFSPIPLCVIVVICRRKRVRGTVPISLLPRQMLPQYSTRCRRARITDDLPLRTLSSGTCL